MLELKKGEIIIVGFEYSAHVQQPFFLTETTLLVMNSNQIFMYIFI